MDQFPFGDELRDRFPRLLLRDPKLIPDLLQTWASSRAARETHGSRLSGWFGWG